MLPHVGELAAGERRDVLFLDEDLPAVGLYQTDDVSQGDALAGAAASEQAERSTRRNLERNVVQYLQRPERLGDVIESHGVHPDTAG